MVKPLWRGIDFVKPMVTIRKYVLFYLYPFLHYENDIAKIMWSTISFMIIHNTNTAPYS